MWILPPLVAELPCSCELDISAYVFFWIFNIMASATEEAPTVEKRIKNIVTEGK